MRVGGPVALFSIYTLSAAVSTLDHDFQDAINRRFCLGGNGIMGKRIGGQPNEP